VTTAEFDAAIAAAWLADTESEPMPAITLDRLAGPCWCGAACVILNASRTAVCRDHMAVKP
jgi:hypothetical protein